MRLSENERICFNGSRIQGLGFTLTLDQADGLISHDQRNADVIQSYIIGKDLSRRPDFSASRCVINFRDWPLSHAEDYPDCIDIVRHLVKPERDKLPDYKKRVRGSWWRYEHQAPTLYESIDNLRHVLAMRFSRAPSRTGGGTVT
jgi:hypothetical protein